MEERFQALAVDVARFSKRVRDIIVPGGRDRIRLAKSNLEMVQTIFGKWCIEIFVILYNLGPMGFEAIREELGGISPRVLSRKLRMLKDRGFVARTLIDSRPPAARYSLTDHGLIVARIGTVMVLLLSLPMREVKGGRAQGRPGRPLWPEESGRPKEYLVVP